MPHPQWAAWRGEGHAVDTIHHAIHHAHHPHTIVVGSRIQAIAEEGEQSGGGTSIEVEEVGTCGGYIGAGHVIIYKKQPHARFLRASFSCLPCSQCTPVANPVYHAHSSVVYPVANACLASTARALAGDGLLRVVVIGD